ncbi:flagellar hook-associated protein FlgL [Alicyclobacillus fructus]|uniref:flagellar hook-associated protein FlgL n=1 Tax=Alicyclobacillus fructus TaxID=2816082 RepID=UPI001A8D23AA|nr:flagellar hook-associated protein FlgL [Alicyclobacillus fructus]
MRITQGMLSNQVLYDIENNLQQLSRLETEASTGKRINQPADDPIGVQNVMTDNLELAFDQEYQQNATTAQSQLNFVSSVMNEAQNVMSRARDLAVEGANSTETASDMQALASEVGQLYDQLVTIGNSQYNGQYIFNGANTASAPYPAQAANLTPDKVSGSLDPAQSVTNAGQVYMDLGNGVTLPITVSGNQFFGSQGAANNAFSVLSQLYNALNSGDHAQVDNLLNNLDSVIDNMNTVQANVGALINRAEMMQTRMTDLSSSVTQQLSNVDDADMAQVLTNLNSISAVEQASLEVGAQALPMSLVNFLRPGT